MKNQKITKRDIIAIAQEIRDHELRKISIDQMPHTRAYAKKWFENDTIGYTHILKINMMLAQDALNLLVEEWEEENSNAPFVTCYLKSASELKQEGEGATYESDLGFILKEMQIDTPIMLIDRLFIDKLNRRKGLGSKFIQEEIATKPNALFITAAGALYDEYPEEPTAEEYEELFKALDAFYSKNGFVNINQSIGQYEAVRVYMYAGNEIGKKVLTYLQDRHEAWLLQMEEDGALLR